MVYMAVLTLVSEEMIRDLIVRLKRLIVCIIQVAGLEDFVQNLFGCRGGHVFELGTASDRIENL
jgi:hypothetical protein